MKTSKVKLYFCEKCKSKFLENDNLLTICPKCGADTIAGISNNVVQVVLNEKD